MSEIIETKSYKVDFDGHEILITLDKQGFVNLADITNWINSLRLIVNINKSDISAGKRWMDTDEYALELKGVMRHYKKTELELIRARRGRSGGTFCVPELASAYVSWVNRSLGAVFRNVFSNPVIVTNSHIDYSSSIMPTRAEYLKTHEIMLASGMKVFYVYWHTINDEIVYVGKGTGDRAWSTNRSQTWIDTMESIDYDYQVDIVKTYFDEDAAYQHEAQLIKELNPRLNISEGHTSKL